MAINLLYKEHDMRYTFFTGDVEELKRVEKRFNMIPSYMFLPSFRGIPKPEVFFHKFKATSGQIIYYCHSGLWKTIVDWCKDNNITVELPEGFGKFKYTDFNLSQQEFEDYVSSWNLTLKPYPYQLKAAWLILKYRQSLSQLATRAGKTLISYIVFRYMMEKMGAKKVLMIVPAKSLVKQAVSDFNEYAEFFDMETVWAGGELHEGSNLTIGTFQSLVKKADKRSTKYDPKFFNDFDTVLVDEAHTLKCYSIDTILNQSFMKNVKLKFGFSGSLPKEHTIDSYCCHSLMGPTIQDIRSKELMDGGFITPIDITQIYINHPKTDKLDDMYIKCGEYLNSIDVGNLSADEHDFTMVKKKKLPTVLKDMKERGVGKQEYIDYLVDLCKARGSNLLLLEQMLVHRDEKRLQVMKELLEGFDKNCIVFAHHTSYLKFLYKYYKEIFPDRPIYLITGQTSEKKREKIKTALLTDKNAVLFASFGCVGTGLTFKNLDYGIFAQSFKSHIINKQALGRGLCLANDKAYYYLYDLIDCYPTNRLKTQGIAKMCLYKDEQFQIHKREV